MALLQGRTRHIIRRALRPFQEPPDPDAFKDSNNSAELETSDTEFRLHPNSKPRFSVLSSSPESIDAFFRYLRGDLEAVSASPERHDSANSPAILTIPGVPEFTVEREINPDTTMIGVLVVDANRYDKAHSNTSSGATLFHDDIDLFRRLTRAGGAWHGKPFCIVTLNVEVAVTRVRDGQLLRLYPPETYHYPSFDPLDLYTPEQRVNGFGMFLLQLLQSGADQEAMCYSVWLRMDEERVNIIRWLRCVLVSIMREAAGAVTT